MKKIIIILLIFLLTGCYDYVEINDLAIITGLIIDYKNNEYEVTSQVIDNVDDIRIYTTTCIQLSECIKKISKQSNKVIFMSHLKTLILTDNLIDKQTNYYDYFLRDAKSKMNFYVYSINNKDKDKLIKILNNESSIYLKNITDFNNKVLSSSYKLSFLDFIYKHIEPGIEIIYPSISIKDNMLYLDNLIAYSNNKIILNNNESIFYNILTNNIDKTTIEIPCDNNYFTLQINKSKTKYKWKNSIFEANVSIKGTITNYNCSYDLSNKETTKMLSNYANNYINKNINKIIKKSKDNNYDFIGIGNHIYKHDNDYFDFDNYNWNNKINDIKTKIKVKTIINSIGESKI